MDSDRDEGNWERGREHCTNYMFAIAIFITVICLPTIFIFRRAPKAFPSKSAEEAATKLFSRSIEEDEAEGDFWPEMK